MWWDLLLLFHFILDTECTQCLHRGWKSQTLWMRSTWNHTKQLVHIDHSSHSKWPRSNPFPQERWLFPLGSSASHFSCEVRCSGGNIFNASSFQVLIDWSQGYWHPLPLRWKINLMIQNSNKIFLAFPMRALIPISNWEVKL